MFCTHTQIATYIHSKNWGKKNCAQNYEHISPTHPIHIVRKWHSSCAIYIFSGVIILYLFIYLYFLPLSVPNLQCMLTVLLLLLEC